jgi:hypothetical protein
MNRGCRRPGSRAGNVDAHMAAHWNAHAVIPANAGIHLDFRGLQEQMDPGVRRDDGV